MFQIQHSGKIFLGKTKEDVFTSIEKYCTNKNIRCVYSKEFVSKHAYTSKRLHNPEREPELPTSNIKFKDAVNGAAALVKCVKGECVDQEEINRRSIICTNCPKLKKVSNCRACGFGGALSKFVNNIKRTVFRKGFEYPNGLEDKYCGICQCSLSMMLPSKMSAFHEDEEVNRSRPDFCWIRNDSENYNP